MHPPEPRFTRIDTSLAAEIWPMCVIGGGAAGMTAAIFAARAGLRVIVLEGHAKPGAKIRVSGGGRCNVLPSASELADFHTEGSQHALRNLFASWPLSEVREFFERDLGIALKAEPNGKLFPASDDAREVVAALVDAANRSGAIVTAGARVIALRRSEAIDGARFELELADGMRLRCARVALCTGGLSLPKTGSDGWGYAVARELGHSVVATYPALVPLLARDPRWGELAGISLVASLAAKRSDALIERRTGDLLFTHKGFSGPVALDVSHHLTSPDSEGVVLHAGWLGWDASEWEPRLLQGGTRGVASVLREALPRRLVELLVALAGVDGERKLAELTRDERKRLVRVLADCPLELAGSEGYRTAEVTGGGIPLAEVVTRTLESRLVPGLYLAGEILDVTGRIGGFNFLWAWVSGRKVGLSAAAS